MVSLTLGEEEPPFVFPVSVSFSMRCRLSCALFVACHFLTGAAKANDALFSEIAMESVFATTAVAASKVATEDGSNSFDRITGPNSLTVALKSAGFEPKPGKESVSTNVESAGWKLPVAMVVDIEQDRVVCRMSLVRIEKDVTVSGEILLALMTASNQIDDASFVFDSEEKMVYLRTAFANRDLTVKVLKGRLMNLADTAIVHAETWMKLKATSTLTSSTASKSDSETAAANPESIVGKWAATLPSNASIAIELNSDGTFKMAHVAGKQSAISSGTLLRKADQLTLSEAGKADVKFQIQSITANTMELRIIDSSGKSGSLIKFSKAST